MNKSTQVAPLWNGWKSLEQGNLILKEIGSGNPVRAVGCSKVGAGPVISKLGCASLCPSLWGMLRGSTDWGDSVCSADGSQDTLPDTF